MRANAFLQKIHWDVCLKKPSTIQAVVYLKGIFVTASIKSQYSIQFNSSMSKVDKTSNYTNRTWCQLKVADMGTH